MANVTTTHNTTPEELTELIFKRLDARLANLEKHFQPKEPEEFMTRKEVCNLLSISYGTLHDWANKGILKPLKKGNRTYYSRTQIVKDLFNSNQAE